MIQEYQIYEEDNFFNFEILDGVITFRPAEEDDLLFYNGEAKKPIVIDWVSSNNIGSGSGTRLMESFISEMKKQGVDLIYLFAQYDPSFYEQPQDEVNGLKRLVGFYQKFGFELTGSPEFEPGYQIDMFLELL